MNFTSLTGEAWYNLPRDRGVAYAAQEAWVQNDTIRVENVSSITYAYLTWCQENIVFGTEFNEARYNKVVYQCGLQRDLSLFEAGDRTEVGEKGLTLSGGELRRVAGNNHASLTLI